MDLTELRWAWRRLRLSPGFAVGATLTLALAIAANSAVFSAVHAVLLRPVAIQDPDRIVVAWQVDAGTGSVAELTHRHWREWTETGRTFESASLMASHNWSRVIDGRGEPARVWFNGVSANFFDTLGVRPILGRAFTAADDAPSAAPVAVLTHAAWQRRFGGDPAIVGTTFMFDGQSVEIIGVMPSGLDLPRAAEFWMPIVPILTGGNPANTRNLDAVGVSYVIGRLREGLDAGTAATELDALERQLDRSIAGRLKWGDRVVATPLLTHVFGPTRQALWALWAAVTVLLVIAGANVAGLVLTRVSQRRHEHAVRTALGAPRAALIRSWLTEIGMVAVMGGLLGLAGATILTRLIVTMAPDDLPGLDLVAVDWTVALFTMGVVIVTTLLVGLVPARHAVVNRIVDAIRPGTRHTADRRSTTTRSVLLVIQIGLAVLLMVAAGLVARSFVNLHGVDLGFTPERVVSLSLQPRSVAGPPNEWMRQVIERVATVGGVRDVGAVSLPPLALGPIGIGARVVLEGQAETAQASALNPTLNYQVATPGYTGAMRIAVRQGRWFTDTDTADSPRVAVVGESTARRLWPGENPIGKRILMSSFTPGRPGRVWREVVGVVNDVRYRGLGAVQLDVYDPASQVGQFTQYLVVRTSVDPSVVISAIREHARALDSRVVVDEVQTLESVVARAGAPWRFSMWLFTLLAGVSCLLACVGLFSVVALDVVERRLEFAVRLALGATGGSIIRALLTRVSVRVGLGLSAGLAAAAATTTLLRSVLFEVGPHDLSTYLVVAAVVIVVVAVAAILPARRAASTSPQMLLR